MKQEIIYSAFCVNTTRDVIRSLISVREPGHSSKSRFCNPCARAESHQQERAQKLCSATLVIRKSGIPLYERDDSKCHYRYLHHYIPLSFFTRLFTRRVVTHFIDNRLRGEKLNYKSVAKEVSKPLFFGSWSQWASKFTVFVRFTFPLNVSSHA